MPFSRGNTPSSIVITMVVIILIILAYGIYASVTKPSMEEGLDRDPATTQASEEGVAEEGVTIEEDGSIIIDNEPATPAAQSTGSYEAYAPEKIARAANGNVVLFFHAAWCPTCRALEADINSNRSSIPDGVTILKTDFDTQTALRQKYGVTVQHTLVQVDAQGNMIAKWSGSPSLLSVLGRIQ